MPFEIKILTRDFKNPFFNMLSATGDISYCSRLGYPEADAEMEFDMQDTYCGQEGQGSRIGQMEKSSAVRAQQSLS